MRAVIIPNDPIKAYIKKGEVVERYFNPMNIFRQVDIVSLDDSDVNTSDARSLAGSAGLAIHAIGAISPAKAVIYKPYLDKIAGSINVADADIIIAHNSSMAGFLAARLGRSFNVPVIIFMHTNPDKDIRAHIGWSNVTRKAWWCYSSMILENHSLRAASKVICAYRFIFSYLLSRGVPQEKIGVVYHRIDVERFQRAGPIKVPARGEALRILCVGRIFERKNPENIIRGIKDLPANLTLIGDGPYLGKMVSLSEELGVRDRVNFIKSIPNAEIDRYYKDAHVFASVNDYGGVSKPVMEAMASSLPIVVKKPLWEDKPELIDECSIVTDGSAEAFAKAFRSLLGDGQMVNRLGRMGFEKLMEIKGDEMEKREADIILSVIRRSKQ